MAAGVRLHEADGTESPSGVRLAKAPWWKIDVASSWLVCNLAKLNQKVLSGYASGGLAGEISQDMCRYLDIVSVAAFQTRIVRR